MTAFDQYFPFLFCMVTLGICLYAGPLSHRLRVVDYPDGGRKGHAAPTPLIGGIAIMLPLALWCLVMLIVEPEDATRLHLTILLCGMGVAVMGFMDDQAPVSARSRFLMLIIFAILAFTLDPELMSDHLNWAGQTLSDVPVWAFGGLIVVGLVGLVSAINMADGMNGLVLTLYLVWFLALALIAGGAVQQTAILVSAMLIVTLLFNARGRLFLGDCGTFAITFVLGILIVAAHNAGRLSYDQALTWFFIPIADCLRLIGARLARGRSPFLGDKNHFHHRLIQRFGHRMAFALYTGGVTAAVATSTIWPDINLIVLAASLVFYTGFLLMPRPAKAVAAPDAKPRERKVVKLRDRWERARPRNRGQDRGQDR